MGVIVGLVVGLLSIPGDAMAHGIGGRGDLPVPLEFFLVGAALALVVSFVALTVMWPEPRLQAGPIDRPLFSRWLRPVTSLMAVIGLAGLVWWWVRAFLVIPEDAAMWRRSWSGSISGW